MMPNKSPSVLPRRIVLKAIVGLVLIIAPVLSIALGYRGMGIFFVVPMVVGALLTKEYFRELGFKS